MASKAFAKAMKSRKKQFKKSRKAKPGGFSIPEIKDGSYVAEITADAKIAGENDTPVITFKWKIDRGPEKGTSHRQTIWLNDEENTPKGMNCQDNYDTLSKILQVLGYDMDEIDDAEIPDLCEEITKEKPLVRIGLKNNVDKKDAKKKYLNCFFNELLDEESAEDDEEDDEEEDEDEDDAKEEDDEDSDEEEEEEDEDEEEDEKEEAIVKGDEVKYKRKKYDVTSSNKSKETCALKSKKGDVVKNVDWEDITVLD